VVKINPQHSCSHVTKLEISLKDDVLWTVAVGLPIILNAVVEPDTIWFSTIIGEYQDNIRIAATNRPDFELGPPVHSVVTKFTANTQPVEEYELTADIARKLGIDIDKGEIISQSPKLICMLTSHDEHWSSIYPITDTRIKRLILGALEQFAFLRQQDINWEEVIDQIVRLLLIHQTIKLDMRPKHLYGNAIANIDVPIKPQTLKEKLRNFIAQFAIPYELLSRTIIEIYLDGGKAKISSKSI
jgi:hypothetical protein